LFDYTFSSLERLSAISSANAAVFSKRLVGLFK
jgi:hypothetical protein